MILIIEPQGITASTPLSQTDFANPLPAPTAVAKAVPRPTFPPANGDIITPAKAPTPAPTATSFA